jgi:hypothetical protein
MSSITSSPLSDGSVVSSSPSTQEAFTQLIPAVHSASSVHSGLGGRGGRAAGSLHPLTPLMRSAAIARVVAREGCWCACMGSSPLSARCARYASGCSSERSCRVKNLAHASDQRPELACVSAGSALRAGVRATVSEVHAAAVAVASVGSLASAIAGAAASTASAEESTASAAAAIIADAAC